MIRIKIKLKLNKTERSAHKGKQIDMLQESNRKRLETQNRVHIRDTKSPHCTIERFLEGKNSKNKQNVSINSVVYDLRYQH